jgi:hypothetical protein
MEQRVLTLDDLCRFCLSNKCDSFSLITLSERHAKQFKDLTKREVFFENYELNRSLIWCFTRSSSHSATPFHKMLACSAAENLKTHILTS